MWFNESEVRVWKAGEIAPARTYVRIDNRSYHPITLEQEGPLPASFDRQVALYRVAPMQASIPRLSDEQASRPMLLTKTSGSAPRGLPSSRV